MQTGGSLARLKDLRAPLSGLVSLWRAMTRPVPLTVRQIGAERERRLARSPSHAHGHDARQTVEMQALVSSWTHARPSPQSALLLQKLGQFGSKGEHGKY